MLLMPEKVDFASAKDTLRMLSQALKRESDPHVTVDVSGLKHFDSSVLAVLLECQRIAHAWGRGFAVRGVPARLAQLAGLYGVAELLLPADTGSAAVPAGLSPG